MPLSRADPQPSSGLIRGASSAFQRCSRGEPWEGGNVPAGRMGAFSEDPAHFLTWNRDRGANAGPWDFLSRRLYRDYILAVMREALQARCILTPRYLCS